MLNFEERRASVELCVLSWKGEQLEKSFKLSSGEFASKYLRSFNIFVHKLESGKIKLVAPRFVSDILKNKGMEAFDRLIDHKYGNKPLMFEDLFIEFAVLYQYFSNGTTSGFDDLLASSISKMKIVTINYWNNRGPKVRKGGQLDRSSIEKITKKKGFKNYDHDLSPTNLSLLLDHLEIGDAFLFGSMSSSADGILKIDDNEVLEWQSKSGNQYNPNNIQKEISKSVVYQSNYRSIFILIYADGVDQDYVYDGGQTYYPGQNVHENMTLVIPSTKRIERFFGPLFLNKFQTD